MKNFEAVLTEMLMLSPGAQLPWRPVFLPHLLKKQCLWKANKKKGICKGGWDALWVHVQLFGLISSKLQRQYLLRQCALF